jgi:hypothetical protein
MVIGKVMTSASILALALGLGTSVVAQAEGTTASRQALLQQFHSPDWHVRADAFYKLVRPLEDEPPNAVMLNHGNVIDPAIRHALINLLSLEADVIAAKEKAFSEAIAAHRTPDLMSEEQSEYWATLNQAVGGLNDPAALNVLLEQSFMGGGYNNTDAIGQFEESILPRLLMLYRERHDQFSRDYLTIVFTDMLKRGLVTDEGNRRALKGIFLARSYDSDRGTRLGALRGLSTLSDPEAKARVREIATSDRYTFVTRQGQTVFPLRQQAEVLLRHNPSVRAP